MKKKNILLLLLFAFVGLFPHRICIDPIEFLISATEWEELYFQLQRILFKTPLDKYSNRFELIIWNKHRSNELSAFVEPFVCAAPYKANKNCISKHVQRERDREREKEQQHTKVDNKMR